MRHYPALVLLGLLVPALAQGTEPVFGKVEPHAVVRLGFSVNGIVQQVSTHLWQPVESGQILVELDPRPFQTRLDEARAQLKRLQLADEEAEREYRRQQELYERMSIARRDLLLAEIERESARSRLLEARAQQQLRVLELEYSRLKAPCNGLVTALDTHTGQAVSNTMQVQTLLELTCTTPWKVTALLDQDQRRQMKTGQIYRSRKGAQLRLVAISPWPDADDPAKRHRAHFQVVDDGNLDLRPGKRLEILP